MTLLGIVVALGSAGCCATYKDALCKLSQSSSGVATHYEAYVSAEPDPPTKAAREAEAKQFRAAIKEAGASAHCAD